MSSVLHRRENHVAISADESGRELANTSPDIQAEFFHAMADEIELRQLCPRPYGRSNERPTRKWGDDCRKIADELQAIDRERIAAYLETLIEHLREPRECSSCEGTGKVVDTSGNFPSHPGVTAGPVIEWMECPRCCGTKVE